MKIEEKKTKLNKAITMMRGKLLPFEHIIEFKESHKGGKGLNFCCCHMLLLFCRLYKLKT